MLGRYTYNIDQKGRISIPAKMRDKLGAEFVVSKGLDECLKIYPMPEWDTLMAKIGEQSFTTQQKLRRFFCEKAQKFVLDKQGRFCIPQELRDYAGLEETAIIVGMESTIEVWNEARWNAINSDITSENIVSLMEEIGF